MVALIPTRFIDFKDDQFLYRHGTNDAYPVDTHVDGEEG